MGDLILNPNLSLARFLRDGKTVSYRIAAPVRGHGPVVTLIDVDTSPPDVIEVIRCILERDDDVELDESLCNRLTAFGVLVYEHEVSRPVTFRCPIEEPLPDDTPSSSADKPPLIVNPHLEIGSVALIATRLPELARFLEPTEGLVTIVDPMTHARLPYWLDGRDVTLVRRLRPGAPPPSDLDLRTVSRLSAAGVLVGKDAARRAQGEVDLAAVHFARNGFVTLRRTLPRAHIAALAAYYRRLIAEGFVPHGDKQVPLRFAQHNEPLMRYYQQELRRYFARVAGQPIKSSYGFFASYRPGATLEKHTDRVQCEMTASLLIDYEGGSCGTSWPLYLELPTHGQEVGIELDVGDSVLFRGCELPHYRRRFEGACSTSYFLHYVDEHFAGALQ